MNKTEIRSSSEKKYNLFQILLFERRMVFSNYSSNLRCNRFYSHSLAIHTHSDYPPIGRKQKVKRPRPSRFCKVFVTVLSSKWHALHNSEDKMSCPFCKMIQVFTQWKCFHPVINISTFVNFKVIVYMWICEHKQVVLWRLEIDNVIEVQ